MTVLTGTQRSSWSQMAGETSSQNYLQILLDPGVSVFPSVFSEMLCPLIQVFFILSPQTVSPPASLFRVGHNTNHVVLTRIKPLLSFSLSCYTRSCSHTKTKLRQCKWSQHNSCGQQGAKPGQSGLPVPAYVDTPHTHVYAVKSNLSLSQNLFNHSCILSLIFQCNLCLLGLAVSYVCVWLFSLSIMKKLAVTHKCCLFVCVHAQYVSLCRPYSVCVYCFTYSWNQSNISAATQSACWVKTINEHYPLLSHFDRSQSQPCPCLLLPSPRIQISQSHQW